ncbi:hypothetical protein [Methylotenera sp.]|uniref:hypothetical protein n=1 Tax=Methylotenera sp. TaxID=2051956 RepID=UPI00273471CC|nr:hypothetical protein [Methylotenera sp.]MDP3307621.1 hypothetical protein [Methylotenera sp.]
MKQQRAKNLDDPSIKAIVEILDGWSEKLTWDLLIEAINFRTHNKYTRQALHKHERIRNAFDLRKAELANGDATIRNVRSPELQKALERIARVEAENRRLESENNQLLEQFVRWSYNAYTRGLDAEFLNQPLPPVNRG